MNGFIYPDKWIYLIVKNAWNIFTRSEESLKITLLQGFVKARLAMFDKPTPKPSRKLVSGDLLSNLSINAYINRKQSLDFLIRQRELRTFKPSKTAEKEKTRGENTDSAKALPRTPELKLHKALP